MNKAPEWSQLSKFHMVSLKWNDPTWMHFIGFPHTVQHDARDRTKAQGRKWKTGWTNVHKELGWSQLSKFDMTALKWNDTTKTNFIECAHTAHPNEQRHKVGNGKWASQMCTRHLGGHNLANLLYSSSNEMTLPKRISSGALTWRDTTCPKEWRQKGENWKWATWTCTRHPGGHNLEILIRPP